MVDMTSTRSSHTSQIVTKSSSTPDEQKPQQQAQQPQFVAQAVSQSDEFMESLKQVAALQKFVESGLIFSTTKVNVNDAASAEYAISVVKHVYPACVIV